MNNDGSEEHMDMRTGLSGTEIDRLVEMVDWAVGEKYRELRWIAPNDGTVPSDELLGVPVRRTGVDDTLHLMGRRLFKLERTLCSLERGPDGPCIVGGPADVAEDCDPDRPLAAVSAGVDRDRLSPPQFTLPLACISIGTFLVTGALAPPGERAEVQLVASTVRPESPGVGDDGRPWAPETGGQWNPVFTQPSELPDAPIPPPAPSDNLREAIAYGEEWAAADAPPVEPVEDVAEPASEPEPVDEPDTSPEVIDGGFVPLPEPAPPVAPPPPPADAQPAPPEVEQIEEAAPPQLDPNDLREAAEHYRKAAEHLDAAAAAIEAGDSSQLDGQGGSVTEDVESPADSDTADDAAELNGVHVSIRIGGLDVTVNGEHHTVDVSITGVVQVDADGNTVVVPDEGGVVASETPSA